MKSNFLCYAANFIEFSNVSLPAIEVVNEEVEPVQMQILDGDQYSDIQRLVGWLWPASLCPSAEDIELIG